MDTYSDYQTLAAHEILNRDYRIRVQDLGSSITIAALHGGLIEPRTSLITMLIASTTFNSYCFEGIKEEGNQVLHITSHRFDEPRAVALTASSEIVVTVHACTDKNRVVYVGGLDKKLGSSIRDALASLRVETGSKEKFAGTHPDNLCNKGQKKKGVQLEFSRGLRDDSEQLLRVCRAIRHTLHGKHAKNQARIRCAKRAD